MGDELGLGASLLGNEAVSAQRGQAQSDTNSALDAYGNVKPPTDLANPLYYQQYQSAGQLTPAQEQTINAAPSQAAQTKANPDLVKAQMQALGNLQQLSNTGLNATDRAQLDNINQQASTQAEGQRQAALQSFAQRGQGGSGNELLAQLQAGQNAANQAHAQGLNVGAQAQSRALQALGQYGNQAGQMNQQQFGQQYQAGNAADELNRFNTQNQNSQQARNVANQNAAQQYNLQNQQNVGNANTGLYNQGLNQQRAGEQQQFQDQLSKAQGYAGTALSGANQENNYANQTAQQWNNIGQGVGQIGSQVMGMFAEGGEAKLGSGKRFENLEHKLSHQQGIHDPAALAASIGRQKYGNAKMSHLAHMADGGDMGSSIDPNMDAGAINTSMSPSIYAGVQAPQMASNASSPITTMDPSSSPMGGGKGGGSGGGSGGGIGSLLPLLALLSEGGEVDHEKAKRMCDLMRSGGKVKAHSQDEKAVVPGNDYANDKVPAVLSEGEIVIPRSATMSEDPMDASARFIAKTLAERKMKGK